MNQNNFYKLKYSKYKNKYIELKKNSNQEGGFRDDTAYFLTKLDFEEKYVIAYDKDSKPIIKDIKTKKVLSERDIKKESRIIIDDKQFTDDWKYQNLPDIWVGDKRLERPFYQHYYEYYSSDDYYNKGNATIALDLGYETKYFADFSKISSVFKNVRFWENKLVRSTEYRNPNPISYCLIYSWTGTFTRTLMKVIFEAPLSKRIGYFFSKEKFEKKFKMISDSDFYPPRTEIAIKFEWSMHEWDRPIRITLLRTRVSQDTLNKIEKEADLMLVDVNSSSWEKPAPISTPAVSTPPVSTPPVSKPPVSTLSPIAFSLNPDNPDNIKIKIKEKLLKKGIKSDEKIYGLVFDIHSNGIITLSAIYEW